MSYAISHPRIPALGLCQAGVLLALLTGAPSCTRPRNVQRTFASPEEAGSALQAAARSGNRNALIGIFGPRSEKILLGGDAQTDQNRLRAFAASYSQMHRWRNIKAGGQVLVVGADNSPFPIPLAKNAYGRWYFDTAAGRDEILARRIGRNELTAMDASKAIAEAEQRYCMETHDGGKLKQYTPKFVSGLGKEDGLYWPAAAGREPSPLGRMGDFTQALNSAGDPQKPFFDGYYYRILTKGATPQGVKDYIVNGKMTGGFTVLAYPSEYRNTGIMSFLIGEDGTLYQKDLGEKTAEAAASLTEGNPQDGWTSTMTQAAAAGGAQE
jgi:hypothetical protein